MFLSLSLWWFLAHTSTLPLIQKLGDHGRFLDAVDCGAEVEALQLVGTDICLLQVTQIGEDADVDLVRAHDGEVFFLRRDVELRDGSCAGYFENLHSRSG